MDENHTTRRHIFLHQRHNPFRFIFQLRGSWILGPILVLVIGQTVQSQSVEQLLAQAKATESIEDLLADAVVEKNQDVAPPEQGLYNEPI